MKTVSLTKPYWYFGAYFDNSTEASPGLLPNAFDNLPVGLHDLYKQKFNNPNMPSEAVFHESLKNSIDSLPTRCTIKFFIELGIIFKNNEDS